MCEWAREMVKESEWKQKNKNERRGRWQQYLQLYAKIDTYVLRGNGFIFDGVLCIINIK